VSTKGHQANTDQLLHQLDHKIAAEEHRLSQSGGVQETEEFWGDRTASAIDLELQQIADEALRRAPGVAVAVEMMEERRRSHEVLGAAFQGSVVRLECMRCFMIMPGNARGMMSGRFLG